MSIDTNPDIGPPFGSGAPGPNQCPACYDPGETPNCVWGCFAGIKIGALWVPADPDPPNGPFALFANAACSWITVAAGCDFLHRNLGPFTQTLVNVTGGVNVFFRQQLGICKLWSANAIAAPAGNKYYGGWCMVVPSLEGGSWSIPESLQLLSEDPFWAQWLNPRPNTGEDVFYNLYDGTNRVNVKIKIDHS